MEFNMSNHHNTNESLVQAQNLINHGIIFPIIRGTKKPTRKRGFKDSTTDIEQIENWWKNTGHSIGIGTDKSTVGPLRGIQECQL